MTATEVGDPFGTAALRAGVVAAWKGSPTRLREDAATEADLVRSGYRDRLLTELAQNAADAAAKAGVPGRITVWLDGRTLHVANSGVALDVSGVHALTALRASDKPDNGESVGRFGVGFTAVLTVSDEVEFRSTSGSVRFSRAETWALLGENGIEIPAAAVGFEPPALRLAWASAQRPAAGFDSEIVLRLRADVDIVALLAAMRAEAADLLLELPALQTVRIEDDEIASTVRDLDDGMRELRIDGPDGEHRVWWQYRTERARWLLPVRNGRPVAAHPDVLRAPTRSDEELSLPALLIADIAMQPDRRRLLPGGRVAELASGYADFARALPPRDRLVLVPAPAFARSEVDGQLREALIEELRDNEWLPVILASVAGDDSAPEPAAVDADIAERDADSGAAAPEQAESSPLPPDLERVAELGASRANGRVRVAEDQGLLPLWEDEPEPEPADPFADLDDEPESDDSWEWPTAIPVPMPVFALAAPRRASVFTGVTTDLADLLSDLVGPLVIPELSGRQFADALAVLDVHRIGLARIAELSSSLERAPQWWYSLYDALDGFATDPLSVEELGALAVPLTDGRLVTGPRTAVLDDQLETAIPVHWARLVHPEAAHELLGRLGARAATPEDLLNDPALQALLEDDPADPDTVDAVLGLAAQVLDTPGVLPTWLGLLELPDEAGESAPADELLLPGAPLARVLVADSPFTTIAAEAVERYGAEALRAIGVGWSFTLVSEEDPTGPDHDLDDEDTWWEGLVEDPPRLLAVRDLDLVDEAEWPEALRLLLSDAATRPLLADRDGYTAWWLHHHAHIDGIQLGLMRHPDDTVFAGLLPQLPGFDALDLTVLRGVLADPDIVTVMLAEELLDALADPARTPLPEPISQTYRLLAEALESGRLDVEELVLPDQVRALSGEVIGVDDALVLDLPWWGPALPPERLVVSDLATARSLATLLELPLASEVITAEVVSTGRATSWIADPLGVLLRLQFDLPTPAGDLVVHEELLVRLSGAYEATVAVAWWRDGDVTHVQSQPQNMARR